jgi:hypothetical protein
MATNVPLGRCATVIKLLPYYQCQFLAALKFLRLLHFVACTHNLKGKDAHMFEVVRKKVSMCRAYLNTLRLLSN